MTEQARQSNGARVLSAGGGLIVGDIAGVRDRFMIDGNDTGDRFALVQHLFAPKALAAPMHRHHKEDEYTFVVKGRIGAILGEEEIFGEPGDLIFKSRNQWHTFLERWGRARFRSRVDFPRRVGAVLSGTRDHDGATEPGVARRTGGALPM